MTLFLVRDETSLFPRACLGREIRICHQFCSPTSKIGHSLKSYYYNSNSSHFSLRSFSILSLSWYQHVNGSSSVDFQFSSAIKKKKKKHYGWILSIGPNSDQTARGFLFLFCRCLFFLAGNSCYDILFHFNLCNFLPLSKSRSWIVARVECEIIIVKKNWIICFKKNHFLCK